MGNCPLPCGAHRVSEGLGFARAKRSPRVLGQLCAGLGLSSRAGMAWMCWRSKSSLMVGANRIQSGFRKETEVLYSTL